MTDYSELKRLAEAFPADLDWDSNTEPFFNGPSGESLGGGSDGTYVVYGKPFRLDGEDYDYDGPTYVERCGVDFAKFMVSARDGVLALIAENERLESEALYSAAGFDVAREEVARIKAENEALRKGSGKAADALAAARKALMVARPRTATHMELMTAALYSIDAAINQGEQA